MSSALALAAFYINHRRECAICSRAIIEPRGFDLRRCNKGHRLALAYVLTLRAERGPGRIVPDDVQ